MKDLFVHDLRLVGRTPPGNYPRFDVDETTPLSYFVTRTLQEAAAYRDEVRLLLHTHGWERKGLGGGFGLVLCREGLTLDTVDALAPLNGHIHGGIVLYGCGAAHIAPGREGRPGDGNLLCSRMAQITGTTVTAGTADQYSAGLAGPRDRPQDVVIHPCDFRGDVLVYGPSGAVIEVHPYIWFNQQCTGPNVF